MKGVAAVILIALVAMASILVAEGIFFNVFIGKTVSKEEAARELEVIRAVNTVESVKRGLPYTLYYSFSEALKANNYNSVEDIKNSADFVKSINPIFGEYRKASKDKIGVKIPDGAIRLDISGNEALLDFSSGGLLAYESSFVKVFDNPNVTIKIVGNSLISNFKS